MPANTDPIFGLTPLCKLAQVSTANTARDGTGTLVDVHTGTANGDLLDSIEVVATGTTTAGVVRLFINDGTNTRLFKEILVSAITPSTTVEVFRTSFALNFPFPSGHVLKASTNNAETFNLIMHGKSY